MSEGSSRVTKGDGTGLVDQGGSSENVGVDSQLDEIPGWGRDPGED